MQPGENSFTFHYPYPPNPPDHNPLPPPSSASSAPLFASNHHQPPPSSSSPPYPYPQYPHFPTPNSHSYYNPPPPSSSDSSQALPQDPLYPFFHQNQPPSVYSPPQLNPTFPNSPHPPVNPVYENLYSNDAKFDETRRSYLDGGFTRPDFYGPGAGYGGDDGVYAYQGSKVEPYGARGTAPNSSTWSAFDDFGRPIGNSPQKATSSSLSAAKPVIAVPKAEAQQDAKSGVQKFRVKLLAEGGGQTTMDVLCQIGLDGIRMLDPGTGRTLRIYPLNTITRCEVIDSSTFAFCSKSTVDIDPRRIRLQSNSYTTNTLLDTVTAATVQFKEIGARSSESSKMSEQPTEKTKGLADWMNIIKPVNEEKDHWVPDEAVSKCTACGTNFSAFVRKHHCRNCGDIFCDKCTHGRIALTAEENAPVVRVCSRCMVHTN